MKFFSFDLRPPPKKKNRNVLVVLTNTCWRNDDDPPPWPLEQGQMFAELNCIANIIVNIIIINVIIVIITDFHCFLPKLKKKRFLISPIRA